MATVLPSGDERRTAQALPLPGVDGWRTIPRDVPVTVHGRPDRAAALTLDGPAGSLAADRLLLLRFHDPDRGPTAVEAVVEAVAPFPGYRTIARVRPLGPPVPAPPRAGGRVAVRAELRATVRQGAYLPAGATFALTALDLSADGLGFRAVERMLAVGDAVDVSAVGGGIARYRVARRDPVERDRWAAAAIRVPGAFLHAVRHGRPATDVPLRRARPVLGVVTGR